MEFIDTLRSIAKETGEVKLYYPGARFDFDHANVFEGEKVLVDSDKKFWPTILEMAEERYGEFELTDNKAVFNGVVYYLGDVDYLFPEELESGFDVCMERRGCSILDPQMRERVLSAMNPDGLLITLYPPVIDGWLGEMGFEQTGWTDYGPQNEERKWNVEIDRHVLRKVNNTKGAAPLMALHGQLEHLYHGSLHWEENLKEIVEIDLPKQRKLDYVNDFYRQVHVDEKNLESVRAQYDMLFDMI